MRTFGELGQIRGRVSAGLEGMRAARREHLVQDGCAVRDPRVSLAKTVTALGVFALALPQLAALRTAAGGTSGTNGFADVSKFLDNLATYVIYLAIPLGALALIAAGGMLIAGNQDGTSWLARTAVGVGIVLLAKGIMA